MSAQNARIGHRSQPNRWIIDRITNTREKKFQHRIILGNLSHFTCHDPIITPIFLFVEQLLYNYIRYYGSAWIIYTTWAHTRLTPCALSLSSLPSIVRAGVWKFAHIALLSKVAETLWLVNGHRPNSLPQSAASSVTLSSGSVLVLRICFLTEFPHFFFVNELSVQSRNTFKVLLWVPWMISIDIVFNFHSNTHKYFILLFIFPKRFKCSDQTFFDRNFIEWQCS